jgi:PKD repeat protein
MISTKERNILKHFILLFVLLSCVGVAASASASLTPVVTEHGKISISVDGLGTANTGTIQAEKPVNATVRSAYLTAASGWGNNVISDGAITIDGTGVNWDTALYANCYNTWADITPIVKNKIDSAPAGRIDFTVTNSGSIDGQALIVIFNDPSQEHDNTIILLFGGQDPVGDSFKIALSEPINKTTPDLLIDMGLGISFSYQPGSQVSIIDVNSQRLTSSAGGQDDAISGSGRLITVGGLDDSNDNPVNPSLSNPSDMRYDDELYNLLPFVSDGDTNITVFTQNPSNDDNIFFAYFFMKSTTAIVGEGIILSPSNSTAYMNTQHTLTATLQDDSGSPLADQDVTFTIVSGPNSGTNYHTTTDATGKATFPYTGTSEGVDTVEASFIGSAETEVVSNQATVFWTSQYSTLIEFSENGNSTYANSHSTIVNVTDPAAYNQSLQYSWIQNNTIGAPEDWISFSNGDTLMKDVVSGDWYLHIKALDNEINVNYSISNVFKLDNEAPVYTWVSQIVTAATGENITIELNAIDNVEIVSGNISVDGQEYSMDHDSSNYSWNISIPSSDSGILVSSIIYNCTFTDIAGNTNTTGDISIDVSILPIASFSADVTRGVSPLTVSFLDNSSGLVENWFWDFGDGNTSVEQSPVHTFDMGNYTVNLTVTNQNGTSTQLLNVRAASEPEYVLKPDEAEQISVYGEELNFSVNSTLFSSFEWFIDGVAPNGSGIMMDVNTNDSSLNSYCLINTSQYINQNDFFMEVYNVSVLVSNESIGRTDTFSWEWTVTNSTASSDDICFVVNRTANITIDGNTSIVEFNTSDDVRTDNNGIPSSIVAIAFNTSSNATGTQLKIEVLDKSSLNESETGFSKDSVYQYLDISFSNSTLVNNMSTSRNIEFRVLNELDGGTLVITSVRLRHWGNPAWETYIPVLVSNDGTYSYYIVYDVSGFSPFAITANYDHPSARLNNGMSAYLKLLLMNKWAEERAEPEEIADEWTGISDMQNQVLLTDTGHDTSFTAEEGLPDESSSGNIRVAGGGLLIALLLLIFSVRRKSNK